MNVLAINLLFSTLVFWLAARLWLVPRIPAYGARAVLLAILLLHAFRHLGLMFLAPGATRAGMPAGFAVPAAIGDLVAALLAVTALVAVARNARGALALVWAFNVEGSVDLVAAIALATIHGAEPFMGPAYWIPAFWVPALLVTHWVAFRVLWGARRGAGQPAAPGERSAIERSAR